MSLAGLRSLRWVIRIALVFVLMGSMDLSFGEQADGGAPFFNDSGSLTLPPQSTEEMQESMPELNMFPPQAPPDMLPGLGNQLEAPEF